MSEADLQKMYKRGEKSLYKASIALNNHKLEKAKKYAQNAQELFEFTQSRLREAEALLILGEIQKIYHNWNNAINLFKQALKKQDQLATLEVIAKTNLNIAYSYYFDEKYEQAHEFAQSAINLTENSNNKQVRLLALILMGKLFLNKKEIDSAIFYFNLANENFHEIHRGFHQDFSDLQNYLGLCHYWKGNISISTDFYLKTLDYASSKKNYPKLSAIHYKLAQNYYISGKTKEALTQIKKAISIRISLKLPQNNRIISQYYYEYAKIMLRTGDFAQAEEICEKGIIIAEENKFIPCLIEGLLLTAKILLNRSKFSSDTQNLIQNYLNEAHQHLDMLKISNQKIELHLLFHKYYKKINEIKPAISHLETALKLSNQIDHSSYPSEIYEYYGLYYQELKDYDLASEYFNKSIENISDFTDPYLRASIFYNSACNAAKRHDPDATVNYLKKSFHISTYFKRIAKSDHDLRDLIKTDIFQKLLDK